MNKKKKKEKEKERILVIDNNKNHRGIIASSLLDLGYLVIETASGEQALKILYGRYGEINKYTGGKFDFALIATSLGGEGDELTGIKLVERINEAQSLFEVKMIMMCEDYTLLDYYKKIIEENIGPSAVLDVVLKRDVVKRQKCIIGDQKSVR